MSFESFFREITSCNSPMPWQAELASDADCVDRLVRVPTGFGKTLGVLCAWMWHRLECGDDSWPRRLVWCLPMRVLVEQTEQEARKVLNAAGRLWSDGDRRGKVCVHSLMGGADAGEWQLHPEECAVLIGTQDMLLSRAMNRGYGAARARWPMEFGLLNQDCLWIMDEVQLMDVGLATSVQLQVFRDEDTEAGSSPRPCRTWWMSATLQRDWLGKSPDAEGLASGVGIVSIPPSDRTGRLWDDVRKPCRLKSVEDEKELASLVSEALIDDAKVPGLVLVVVNRVDRAAKVYDLLKADKAAAPYDKSQLEAAQEALEELSDVSPLRLESFEEDHPEMLPRLYPYDPPQLLLRHELEELFDTAPDLSGADIDISRFIRTGDERDVRVFWADVPDKEAPDPSLRPSRNALCAVPFLKARDWLCGKATKDDPKHRLLDSMRAWTWDWLNGEWKTIERRDLIPGRTVLVDAGCGGYDPERGWNPGRRTRVEPVPLVEPLPEEIADASADSDATSVFAWQTIAVHGREAGAIAKGIAEDLVPELAGLFGLCGRWHDAGKAHPAFQNCIVGENRPDRPDIAKAERSAWLAPNRMYPVHDGPRRAGFRHELVGVLALFSALRRVNQDHPALLGPWRQLLEAAGFAPPQKNPPNVESSVLDSELAGLSAEEFDLLAYLVCVHHGKVRMAWHTAPADQAANDLAHRIAGVKDGDKVPEILLADADGAFKKMEGFDVDLSLAAAGLNPRFGMGWTERVLKLLETRGPFALAWLEAIFRAADQRASRQEVRDELLHSEETP